MSIRLFAPLSFLLASLALTSCGGGGGGNDPVPATLEVIKTGAGSGTVSGDAINCGTTCTANTVVGGTVTLTATPGAGQVFDGWGGDAVGCGTALGCNVAINGTRAIARASFSPIPSTTVTAVLAGNGMGSVTSSPQGINCSPTAGSDCSETFTQGGMVTLTATPTNANNVFSGWSGNAAGCGTSRGCTLMLSGSAINAVASFQPVTRTLTVSQSGNGTVTSNPAGINCGSSCSGSYQQGSMVTLTATPSAGFTFQGWGGACSGTANCVLTMDADKSVTASFISNMVSLSVSKLGNGTVTSSPAGINCGTTCSANFNRGSSVTLTATPAPGETFQGWSGGGCTGSATCTPNLQSNVTVTASFTGVANPGELFGLTNTNRIVSFERSTPQTFRTNVPVTGLNSGESVVAIDTRPSDGLLYGLTNRSRLVTIDPTTGTATARSTLTADAADTTNRFTALSGTTFGIDFNPVVDRLRILSDAGENLRVNVDSGATTTDTQLNPGTPAVLDGAYTFNFNGSTTTTLFVVDTASDKLFQQVPPNDGTLVEVGTLGTDAGSVGGFEIIGSNVDAFAVLKPSGGAAAASLFRIDLRSGAATKVGDFTGSDQITSLAARVTPTPSVPGNLALLTASGKLLTVDRAAPAALRTSAFITGIGGGESPVDVDYRPQSGDGQLLLLTRDSAGTGRLYLLNAATGAANPLPGNTGPTIVGGTTPVTLVGDQIGMDLNPVVDLLRVITSSGQNLRVNVSTGAVTSDTAVSPSGATVVAAAYTNAFTGAGSTTLYTLDSSGRMLNIQDPPNNGVQVPVGPLGLPTVTAPLGFDINAINNEALMSMTDAGSTKLYSINLTSGAATNPVDLPSGETFRGLTLRTPKEPQFVLLSGTSVLRLGHSAIATTSNPTGPALNGLPGGVTLLGWDFRPKTGQLVALGSDAKLYTVNPETAAATLLAELTPDSNDTDGNTPFAASMIAPSAANIYSVDFNPVADRLRVVGAANKVNLRINVDTGTVITDAEVGRPPFAITGAGYGGGTQPVLYGLDSASDRLFTIDQSTSTASGNPGRLTQIGALGIDVDAGNGFDVFGADGFAVGGSGNTALNLYAVNLSSGAAILRGAIGVPNGNGSRLLALSSSTLAPNNLFAITDAGRLVEFDRNNPGTLLSNRALSGIGAGETVIGMDYRAGTNGTETHYVVTRVGTSTDGKLYTVTPQGAASAVMGPPSLPNNPTGTATFALPAGSASYGVDINPSTGALRITTDNAGNIEVNVSTLVVSSLAALNQTVPAIGSQAYTASFDGATSTRLFGLDHSNDSLMTQGKVNPNDGQLFDLRALGVNIGATGGFDILGGADGYAVGVLQSGTQAYATIYRIDLTGIAAISPVINGDAASSTVGRVVGQTDNRKAVGVSAVRFTP